MDWLRTIAATGLSLALAGGVAWAQDEGDAEPAGEAAAQPSDPNSWLDGWEGSASLGLNGSTGNTEVLNFRAGLNAVRDTSDQTTTFDIAYLLNRDDGDNTENRLDSLLRNDWKFGESPWRAFATARYEYDQFKDWDSRLSLFAGPGYIFIDDEKTFLMGRAGAGLVREWGSSNNEWQPEGLLGVDYERQLTERQKLTATVEYYPSLQHASHFRLLGRAAWELLVDPEINMSLKAGIEDEYNSNPSGDDERNDLRYFVLLVWSF
ncbi:MAG: YdiY family protein [Phycisphaerales bacterium JB039]